MKIANHIQSRAQLTLLLLGMGLLLALSFLPNSRAAINSSETRFAEASRHGLNIVPASCASSPSYFHGALSGTADGGGFLAPAGGSEYGAYAPNIGMYVCVTNPTGYNLFVPAATANELQTFKNNAGGAGVSAW